MFSAGSSNLSIAYQRIYLSKNSSLIDLSEMYFQAGGWIRDGEGRDCPLIRIEFFDGSGVKMSNFSTGRVKSESWNLYEIVARVPAGTRAVRVWLESSMAVGPHNDGYFDGLFFNISVQPPFLTRPSIVTGPYLQNATPDTVVVMWETDRPWARWHAHHPSFGYP